MSGLLLFHVAISLVAIVSGFPVVYGFLTARRYERWTLIFMVTTIATLVTGFMFPYNGFTPAIGVGILCTAIFIPTAAARYVFRMAGGWRRVFVIGSLVLFYFNCFVLIAQSFQKVPALNALAPTGSEPPFAISQAVLLVVFLIVGFLSVRRSRAAVLGL
ncbi:hypothetical protein [Rhizobium sp. RAF56]|jgi:hypothetical protein|uniref:hypothetical protein n=1 Tax=Rhizobium sp. RAF56 TaxID=3233062 RepID=UPI003F9CCC72